MKGATHDVRLDARDRILFNKWRPSMIKVPVMYPSLTGNEKKYVLEALESTWIGGEGSFLTRFEKEWADVCGVKECIAVSNGTVALHMALLAMGIGQGDEVIVPALTYVATANAVRYVGAEPVFTDIDPKTWCLDPRLIEASITRRTRCIIPVHLHGHPADIDEIRKVAALYNVSILCDAAQAHMAVYKGKPVGSHGDIETFSFHVGKIFTCGEGGAITLNNSRLADWIRMVKSHGMDPSRRFFHPVVGYNYRLTNVQAAILCAQIERRQEIIAKRRHIFNRYTANLRGTPGLSFQPIADWAEPCPWVFAMTVDPSASSVSRDRLMAELRERGIECRPLYTTLNKLPQYRELSAMRGDHCPEGELLSSTGLYLPSSTDLSDELVDWISEAVRVTLGKKLID